MSNNWMKKHVADHYVKLSKYENYASRAVYKFEAMDKKFSLLKKSKNIVDLGAAPGSWSQYIVRAKKNAKFKLVAVDKLPINIEEECHFIQGDFLDPEIRENILSYLSGKADLVVSDMAPNLSGYRDCDQANIIELAEMVLEFCVSSLMRGGVLVIKLFEGEGIREYVQLVNSKFNSIVRFKPPASRAKSREFYLVARGLK